MRTTLNIDDELMVRVTALFPPGTPKTVIIEEALRQTLSRPPGPDPGLPAPVGELVARGVIAPPRRTGVPPASEGEPLPPGALLRDLSRDRGER